LTSLSLYLSPLYDKCASVSSLSCVLLRKLRNHGGDDVAVIDDDDDDGDDDDDDVGGWW